MKLITHPSLVRRVLFAIFWACLFLWMVLVGFEFITGPTQANRDKAIAHFGEGLVIALSNVDEPGEARAIVLANSIVAHRLYTNREIPFELYIQLADVRGKVLYSSVPATEASTWEQMGKEASTFLNGREVRVYHGETPRWRLIVAQSNVELGWFLWITLINLAPYMLIAFLSVVFPIGFSVYSGLRPLREMSQRIASRHPDDLSATGIVANYAELRPLQEALDSILTKMRYKVASETAFVQEAAHELRTPMAVISAQAHVLALAQDPVERQVAEKRLDVALARASHLVGQLLQLAQVGSDLPLETEEFDLAQEIRGELSILASEALKHHLDLSLEAPDTLHVRLELHTFKSILQNLVVNAIRYLEPGDMIAVSLVQQPYGVLLQVMDDGPGIPLGQRERVFERFHRGTDHHAQGAGLGLAIVRQACQRLGGSVQLETGLGGCGCRFVVRLPTPTRI